jgi:hypothetical protein
MTNATEHLTRPTDLKANYKRLPDGTFGAYIDLSGKTPATRLRIGDAINVVTAKGDRHYRVITGIEFEYASGMVVRIRDPQRLPGDTGKRVSASQQWDTVYNEGRAGGGYNPYRDGCEDRNDDLAKD